MAKAKSEPKSEPKSGTVKIRLRAMGEASALTGQTFVARGGVVEASKEAAEAAVASGRWEYAEPTQPNGDGGGEGA